MHQFKGAEFINNIYNIERRWELEYVGCKLGCRCILWIALEGNGAERKPGCRALATGTSRGHRNLMLGAMDGWSVADTT
jgi:hypothetical protein